MAKQCASHGSRLVHTIKSMTHRLIESIIRVGLAAGIAGALALSVRSQNLQPQTATPDAPRVSRPAADPNKFAMIIAGASGEASYAKQFAQWTANLQRTLAERLGFAEDRLTLLMESPPEGKGARATAEEVRRAFGALSGAVTPESTIYVFFIGHGSFDGKQAKFNLVGPDLTAVEYHRLLGALPARRIVIFNMASASGEFVKQLSAKGRIIITATQSGQEQNATRFTEHFIAALGATDADADHNGRVSVLEAFNYASRLTAEHYTQAGRLATEHALIEDNGDGIGHKTAESGDGALARVTYFDSLTATQASANAEVARLLRERTRLEEEVEQLKAQKSGMPGSAYETTLEKLLIELAKVSRDLRKGGL